MATEEFRREKNNKPQKNCLITVTAFHCVLGFSLLWSALTHPEPTRKISESNGR